MQQDLFQIDDDYLCGLKYVTIDDLKSSNVDVEWVKYHSNKINLSSINIIRRFEQVNSLPIERCPQYYCSAYWGEATRNFKWRYILVCVGERRFLVFLRLVGIMYNQQYFSLSYDILPSDGIKSGVDDVKKAVLALPCVKSVETIVDDEIESCDNANYYCDRDNATTMNKNRRNKYKRSLSLVDDGLVVKLITKQNVEDFICESERLYGLFSEKRFSFNINNPRNLLKISIDDTDNCYVYGFYMKDVLIGVQMACNDFMNCISVHFAKDITSLPVNDIQEYVGVDRSTAQRIKNFFGAYEEQFLKNKFLVEMSYDAIFVDGFHSDNPSSMIVHKDGFYPKKVLYKIVRL